MTEVLFYVCMKIRRAAKSCLKRERGRMRNNNRGSAFDQWTSLYACMEI
jgi:hypothetical protein